MKRPMLFVKQKVVRVNLRSNLKCTSQGFICFKSIITSNSIQYLYHSSQDLLAGRSSNFNSFPFAIPSIGVRTQFQKTRSNSIVHDFKPCVNSPDAPRVERQPVRRTTPSGKYEVVRVKLRSDVRRRASGRGAAMSRR